MDHDTLNRLRQAHPAWRILVADHAPLVLSFLTLAFIQPNRRAIPAPEIAAHLDAYLDHLRETYPERYPRSARDYLEDWAAPKRAYLRKYYPKSGPDAEFDLTPATEKAIEWLQTLAPQQFIGPAATEEWFCVRGDDRYGNRNPAIALDTDRKSQPSERDRRPPGTRARCCSDQRVCEPP
jgi:uncharacterized protein DUF3375